MRQVRESIAKRISNCPVPDLTHVLLVDGVDGYFCSAVAVDRRGQKNRGWVVRPVQLEARAVRGSEVVECDLWVTDKILSRSGPGGLLIAARRRVISGLTMEYDLSTLNGAS